MNRLAQAVATAREDALGSHPCNLLAPENEYLDPNPDIHTLFHEYNKLFFEEKLAGCEVKWSKRMTLCYQPRSGFCSIRLSEPLLKLRPRSDLVNTLLHEMIHAYVFVATPVRDHDDHGPIFQAHMHRINAAAMTQITVYHTFHDEVDSYRQHVWQCSGPCRTTPPYFGLVKRSMNRAPGPTDFWWSEHHHKCGGSYTKIKEPAEYTAKQAKKKERQLAREEKQKKKEKEAKLTPSVQEFFQGVGATADQVKLKKTSADDIISSRKREMDQPQQGSGKKSKTDGNDIERALLQFGGQENQTLFTGLGNQFSNADTTKGIVDLTASDSGDSEDESAASPAAACGNDGDLDIIEID
ncbi:hypothetical protein PHYBOEH_004917 [Phytophthora boehmeriae]|uniref:SprT-like domain-containing protein n=1 Tax=Phytophthora boehmeriae TaxID=109152 RepID=A0A8T1XB55_9STRA|nr:hypothetical protein PHYBOEH_004917 [Phytophthora boehmeriae]